MSPNFVAGSLLMFAVGVILSGTLVLLLPPMMQDLMNYPVFDAGWMMAPRGFGMMLAVFFVARVVNTIDARLLILVGFLLTAASLWQMTGLPALYGVGADPVRRLCPELRTRPHLRAAQSSRLVNPAAPHHAAGNRDPRPDAHARRQHRHLGPRDTARSEHPGRSFAADRGAAARQSPDNPLMRPPFLPAPFSFLTTPTGIAALNREVTRQAAMVSYNDDFALMMIVILAALPVLLLVRGSRRRPVAADD